MLDFIYYPVSAILWFWHKVFGFVFGEANAISWILGIIFLTFTVRGIMFKPFVNQVRSMKKMQDFAPEIKKVQKKYANDKQRQAQEMQKLQREHGVNPLGSCLPMLLQIPVFIGLNWVLRNFGEGKTENYVFDQAGNESYVRADIFGVHLGDAINHLSTFGGSAAHTTGWNWHIAPVAIPLMIVASVATHLTARHSAARQKASAEANPQTAIMQKLTVYVFPLGVLVFGAFFPIGLLIYWLANNGWTLMQQRLVYQRIDKEEAEKKTEAKEKRDSLAPKPGQKPRPGQKPNSAQKAEGTGKSGGSASSGGSGKRKAGSPHRFPEQPAGGKNSSGKKKNDASGAQQNNSSQPAAKSNDGAAKGKTSSKTENDSDVPGMITSKKSNRKRR